MLRSFYKDIQSQFSIKLLIIQLLRQQFATEKNLNSLQLNLIINYARNGNVLMHFNIMYMQNIKLKKSSL